MQSLLLTKYIQFDCMTINAPVNSCIVRGTTQVGTIVQSCGYKLQSILERSGTRAKTLAVFGKG